MLFGQLPNKYQLADLNVRLTANRMLPQPLIDRGYIAVPDAPGLGVELNEAVVKEHLRQPGYFEPGTRWDESFVGRFRGGPWPHFNVDGVWVNERTEDY